MAHIWISTIRSYARQLRHLTRSALIGIYTAAPATTGLILRTMSRAPGPWRAHLIRALDDIGEKRRLRPGAVHLLQGAVAEHSVSFQTTSPSRTLRVANFPIHGPHSLITLAERRLEDNYIATVQDALVAAPAMAIIKGVHIIQQSEDTNLDGYAEAYSRFFARRGKAFVLANHETLEPTHEVQAGVLIANRFAKNYYHFLVECLPRALHARAHGFAEVPLLVSDLPAQCIELLSLFGDVHVLPDASLTRVRQLHIPYLAAYAPDDASKVPYAAHDTTYLPTLRRDILARYPGTSGCKALLYAARGTQQSRNVLNAAAVENAIRAAGGSVVNPGQLPIAEQIRIFSGAETVVAPAGAAVANILFCQPGTRVIVLHKDRHVNPGYFAILAQALNLRYETIACRPQSGHIHADYTVDIETLTSALAR